MEVTQVVGRLHTLRAWGWANLDGCAAVDGTASFTMTFFADSGRFAPGKAMVYVDAYGEGGCSEDPTRATTPATAPPGWAAHGPTAIRLASAR